ncbi:hypothetical protein FCL40_17205 [Ferrimonas sediminicola]|uniref:Uncharacterized protein n=1 Tax=Ferrimonas sediminicola TaxID=2569538 RepID=A0A4U1B829_9GAMM|nr:hypothetical protein [Ferrimonas sediminicola]TKB46792.1 hypothetical protein FCL40_17205 [Ferrimonas sediminicola]
MWWRTLLIILAYLVLAAHFLRYGNALVAAPIALLPALLLLRRHWSVMVVQLGLVLSTLLVWLPTAHRLISMRLAFDQPWMRMALILGAVMLCNLLIAWSANDLKARFQR